jgi:hypothetical protein
MEYNEPTREQLITMFNLQQQINAVVDSKWLDSRYPYLRAVVVEGVEAMEHHGWKWWKKQTKDLKQLQMELVDIWHFAMSWMLLDCYDGVTEKNPSRISDNTVAELSADTLGIIREWDKFKGTVGDIKESNAVDILQYVVGHAALHNTFSIGAFAELLQYCELSWNDLFKMYVLKNTLNIFRQQHGDKQGSYVKVWNGKEDNVWLVELSNDMDVTESTFFDSLYQKLETTYQREHVNQLTR